MSVSATSQLIVKLLDQVTGPAQRVARSVLGMPTAVRKANGQMTSFGERMNVALENNRRALERARGGLFDAVAGYYVLQRAIGAPVSAAMGLEDGMADIAKVSGMTDEELGSLKKTLREISTGEIPMAVEELAALTAAAAASGIDNADLEEFTKLTAKSAIAWGMTGAASGEALAKISTQLGLTIEETRAYADAINYLSDTSASEAPDLIEFARRVAADGKVAGFSAEETLALGSAMISAGANADVAATSLRNVGKMLSRGDFGAKKSQLEAFDFIGLDAERVAKAMQADAAATLLLVLGEIKKAPEHMHSALASGIFGDEARALTPLFDHLESTKEQLEAVADSTNYLGSVQKEFEQRSRTGRVALQRFWNQLRDVGISIGDALIPAMKLLFEAIAPYVQAVSNLIQQHPKLVAAVIGFAGSLIGLRVALAALRFVGLFGRGSILSLLALGATALGGTVGHLSRAARASIALDGALAAMAGAGKLGIFRKLASGAKGMLYAIPGVAGIAAAMRWIGGVSGGVGATAAAVERLNRATAAAGTQKLPSVWGKGGLLGINLLGLTSEMSGTISEIIERMGANYKRSVDWDSWIVDNIGTPRTWLGLEQPRMADAGSEPVAPREPVAPQRDSKARLKEGQMQAVTVDWGGEAREGLRSYSEALAAGGAGAEAKAAEIAKSVGEALTVDGKLTIDTVDLQRALTLAREYASLIALARPQSPAETPSASPEQIAEATRGWHVSAQEGLREFIGTIISGGDDVEARAVQIAANIQDILTVDGKLTIDTVDLQRALTLARNYANAIREAQGLSTKRSGDIKPAAPTIDGARAKGGPISAGKTYLVVEEGPETITPNRSGFVHPNGEAAAASPVAAPASKHVNVTVNLAPMTLQISNSSGADAEGIARRVIRIIEDQIGGAMRGVMADVEGAF